MPQTARHFHFRIQTTGFCPTTKTTLSRNKDFLQQNTVQKIDCHTFHWQTALSLSKLYETGTGNNNPALSIKDISNELSEKEKVNHGVNRRVCSP